jgi:hypothetical protein
MALFFTGHHILGNKNRLQNDRVILVDGRSDDNTTKNSAPSADDYIRPNTIHLFKFRKIQPSKILLWKSRRKNEEW